MTNSVTYIPFDGRAFVRVTTAKLKGCALGSEAFAAYAGLYSQALQGGMRASLDPTSPHVLSEVAQVYALAPKDATAVGKAIQKIAPMALVIAKRGRPASQEDHDSRMLEISAHWSSQFRDVAPRAKPVGETSAQKVSRLQAELFAMTAERDALAGITTKAPVTTKAPETAPA